MGGTRTGDGDGHGDGPRDDTVDRPLTAVLAGRLRLLVGAGAVGTPVGAVATVAFLGFAHPGDLQRASARAFALAAIALGFGVLGWSGSVFAGRGFETLQTHLETGTDWTERDSRRAMARIAGFGAGAMVGVVVATTALGGVG